MKKLLESLNSRRALGALLVVLVAITFYEVVSNLPDVAHAVAVVWGCVSPFVGGFFIAYLLSPLTDFAEKELLSWIHRDGVRRILAVLIVMVLLLGALALLLMTIIPTLLYNASQIIGNLQMYFNSAREMILQLSNRLGFLPIDDQMLTSTWLELVEKVSNWSINSIESVVDTSYQIGSFLVGFFISLIIAVYLLVDRDNIIVCLKRLARAFLSDSGYHHFLQVVRRSNRIFMGYVSCNLVDAMIIGGATFLFMLLFRLPFAILVAVIVGITNLIPTFGPIIGGVAASVLLLLTSPWNALYFLIWCIVIQQIDGNIIKPILFGDSTGLPPVWILVSIVIGGRMFGIVGMLLAVPITAIIASFLDDAVRVRLIQKGVSERNPDTLDRADAVSTYHSFAHEEKKPPAAAGRPGGGTQKKAGHSPPSNS